MDQPQNTRSGTVAIFGRPNAGKSTLLNRFLGQKLSIVSPRAQTTRRRILGIDTRDGTQIIFFDTPGLLETKYLLQEAMLEEAMAAIEGVDVCLLLVDPTREPADPGEDFLKAIASHARAVLVAINKIDQISEEEIKRTEARIRSWLGERVPIVRISAERGDGVDALRRQLTELLPGSPFLYPEDEITDLPVRFFVAELIREAVFELFADEIPYSIAVIVDEFREAQDPIYIGATVFVERPSQKGIVIGQGGGMIKRLGEEARRRIEEFLTSRVYLDLWVKVLPKWRKRARDLRRLGYPVPDHIDQ